jgi:hypothetical protein
VGAPNIFAPYRVEHANNLAVGSLWDQWIGSMGTALDQLRSTVSTNATSRY